MELDSLRDVAWGGPTSVADGLKDENCIEIFSKSAGFPHRTALANPKQNRHWKSSIAIGLELIGLFAQDNTFSKTLKNGMTISQVASSLVQKASDDFLRHPIYMFPHANKERASLLEITIVYIFVFDGKVQCEIQYR